MKVIKNITQTKTQKEINISVLDEHYKFKTIPFKLDEHGNYFEVYGNRVTRNSKLSVICDLKSLKGNINNIKFNFESLDKESRQRNQLKKQNYIEFINKLSLNYNNKKWFNIEEKSLARIRARDFSSNEELTDKNSEIEIKIIEETCILNNKITENFSEIPIYWYDKNVNQKYRTTIVVLEIITDILSKKFPSFKTQLHNLCSQELNKANLTDSNLEDISNLSKEELLELYKKEHEENLKFKEKTKTNSLEETEKLYDKYMNESELFRNEIKRINCELFKEFIDNYQKGNKINTSQIIKEQFRSTSSIDLGNIGENYVKSLLDELQIKYEDTSGIKYQSDIHIKDDKDKIIYILEVKNKKSISDKDITKFKRDIDNITNLNPDYTIVPLFISLSNSNINEDKGKFNITDNVTYITLPYVTKETLQMFFELNRNFIRYLHSNEELNKSIKNNSNIINMFLSLTKSSNNIDLLLNNLKKENLTIQEIIYNNLPSNLTIKELQKLKIKIQLILYIKTTSKWTLKGCYEIDKERVIIKSKIRKEDVKNVLGI